MRWCLITIFALCTQAIVYSRAEQCNNDQLERCELAIIRILENNNGFSRQDTESYCRDIYRRLHCLVSQTSMCLSSSGRVRKSPLIHKTWRFLASICDGFAAWWRLDCYRQDAVKHCESRFTDNRNVNYESCKNYRQFRDCASMVVKSRCSSQEQALLGLYLLDKGRERTWLCAAEDPADEENRVSSAPLASGSEYLNEEDCLTTVQREVTGCSKYAEGGTKYTDERREPHSEEICCAAMKYEECASDVMKRYCGRNDWTFLNSLKYEHFGKQRCLDDLKCENSACRMTSATVLYLPLVVAAISVFFK